ncbi:MAG: HlyC/CorC family transporter [Clostridia bacterium]|nr:HlyC/CorC family transporter [Clostridia bacterium]
MDDPGSISYLVAIIILVCILIVEEVVYLVRSALNALPDSRAEELEEHPKKRVRQLIARKDDVFLAISLTSSLMTTLFAMTATLAFARPLMNAFAGLGVPAVWCTVLALIIIPVLSAGLLITLTGIIPRRMGQRRPYRVVTRFAGITWLIFTLQRPAVALSSGFADVLMKLFGLERLKAEDPVTEAEILSQVETAGDTGAIDDDQREMINNIFEFDDVFVSDLMTHRTDVTAVADYTPVAEVKAVAIEEGYSRIPVFHKTIDDIVGVVYVKDLLTYVGDTLPPRLSAGHVMREAFFVPETMRCDKLFKAMNEKRTQIAIAVDEYGGTAGIITFEDLLEALVGSIQDEYDEDEEDDIEQIDENVFDFDGTTDIEEVEEVLGIEIPEGEYDTIGGFIISLLDRIPEDDTVSEADFGDIHFTASEVEDRRIGNVRAERIKQIAQKTDE